MVHADPIQSALQARHDDVVYLDLDFGSFELGVDECSELVRRLRTRGEQPDGAPAVASADRLDALLGRHVGPTAARCVPEEELDAIADAGWEWLERSGPDGVPERVLLALDAIRSRHAHE